ncbi:MAG: xanthine dehydrogenase family protein molybdopterin-binding subunit [Hyphomicrobiaceae bacterium]
MTIEFRKEFFADERDDNLNVIGQPTRRQDILGHVTGRSPYYDDHLFDGLLHLRCVRSPHHHARIRSIDTAEAERIPGVRRILLGRDVPVNLNTLLSLLDFGLDDEPLLSETKVAYMGEPVAAVIADTDLQARHAAAKVRVDWEVLPHVLDVEEAIRPDAPVVNETFPLNKFIYHSKYDHQKLRYGDVEEAFRSADHIVEGRYQMSPIEQAPIETCGAIAAPETNDRWVCYTGTQALFFSLGTAAKLLNTSSARLHFIGGTVGGGFGGKVDSLHEPLAILGAMVMGRPVKYQFDRAEEMQVGAPRGAERWYLKDGVMNDGCITARSFIGYFDSGAYTRLSSYAIIKGVGHLPGPYTIPNVYADVYCVYTNRTPATAMRGFGITGVDFAIENHMDKVAHQIGMDPIELRIRNAYRDRDMKAHRREAKNCALIECCQVAAEKANWSLSGWAQQQNSLTGGGGERAMLPGRTATDEKGRVEGFHSGGYANSNARPVSPSPAPATQPSAAPRPPPPPAPVSRQPSEPPPQQREAPPAGPQPAPAKPRRTPARFSSISGLRRR